MSNKETAEPNDWLFRRIITLKIEKMLEAFEIKPEEFLQWIRDGIADDE
jgi:hypothetical protein